MILNNSKCGCLVAGHVAGTVYPLKGNSLCGVVFVGHVVKLVDLLHCIID